MRRVRQVRPAATVARSTAQVALRVLIASIPLIPWAAAHADATVPGDNKRPGNVAPPTLPPDSLGHRPLPPPPGAPPPPHIPEPSRKKP
jgi:hypothetical protein